MITTGSSQPSRTIITQFPTKIIDTYPEERHILLADSHHSDKRLDLPCTRAPSKTVYVYDTDGNQYELQSVATVALYYALNTHCSVMSQKRFPDNRQDQRSHGQPPVRGIQWCMQRATLLPITGEYLLGPLSNIQDGARLDTAANWLLGEGSFKRTYFDIIHKFRQIKHTNPAVCYH